MHAAQIELHASGEDERIVLAIRLVRTGNDLFDIAAERPGLEIRDALALKVRLGEESVFTAARQKNGVAGFKCVKRVVRAAKVDGTTAHEVKLGPPFDGAVANAEGRRDLGAVIGHPVKAHAHEQFADQIRIGE